MKFTFLKKIKSCKKADKDIAGQAPPAEPSPSDDSGVYIPKSTEEQVVAGEITVDDEIIGIEIEEKSGTKKWLFEFHVVSDNNTYTVTETSKDTQEEKKEEEDSKWKPFDKSCLASIHESGVPVVAYAITTEGTLKVFTEEEEEQVMTHFVADTS